MKDFFIEKRKTYLLGLLLLLLFAFLGWLFAQKTTISKSEAEVLAKSTAAKGFAAGQKAGFPVGQEEGLMDGQRLGTRQGAVFGKEEGASDGWRAMLQKMRALEAKKEKLHGSGAVLVVGDSLEVLTIPYLKKKLPGISLTTNAVGGYNSIQIYDLFQESYRAEHSVIVFDAGTNDNPNYPEILAEQLTKVQERIGPKRCLVLPTIYGYTVDGADSSGKNRVLRQVKKKHKIVYLPNWASIATGRPDLMADELHPNAEGTDLRARMIARAVRKCLERGLGDDPVISDEALGIQDESR